jgi:glycosyltransferase involved in cell wall biosynthesis
LKILFINSCYYPNQVGGTEKVVRLLAKGLHAYNVETVVATTSGQASVNRLDGVKVYYLRLKNLYWPSNKRQRSSFLKPWWHFIDMDNPFMGKEVGKIIDKEQPDLVHTHNLPGFSVAAWKAVKKSGLPLVHTLHDYNLLCPKSTMHRQGRNCPVQCWPCRLFSRPKKRLSGLVDHVVSVSKFLLDRHLEAHYFPGAGSSLIYNPAPVCQGGDRSPRQGKVRFGFLGQLTLFKGIEFLLQVFVGIAPDAATLGVAGTGESGYVNFLRQNYAGPNVHFLGFVPPEELFDQIDVLIVPSLWHESFGLVVLEASSSGIPVIAARRGGISEIVEDGKTGFLFDPSQTGDLKRQIARFLDYPALAAEMGIHCQAKAREFSLARFYEEYLAVYRGLLG